LLVASLAPPLSQGGLAWSPISNTFWGRMAGIEMNSLVSLGFKGQPMKSTGSHFTRSARKFTMDGIKYNSLMIRLLTTSTIGSPLHALARVLLKCSYMG